MSQDKAADRADVDAIIEPFLKSEIVQSMDRYIQHGTVTTLRHALAVTYLSCAIAAWIHLRVNTRNLAIGALLHDFYLYDWHDKNHPKRTLHGFSHPDVACQNALLYFNVNPQIQQIILCHMWPLTLRRIPPSREAIVVCIADKICSSKETICGFWGVAVLLFLALLHRVHIGG